ncbi:ergothioneine biosynthesis protein EgtB [Arenibacter sp. 6A1]|uniref:ergothioneine biosynthesis protein EgtB n=1 Tax=Arenibacter sp. 6A1 TaxID=2720391 RepID=UPI0014470D9A|nr:ergothioneine biosynthesis protein EgtB [Arenibacter sp. 6A1]NKI25630.1 ergothioneine biosynthesis protein EgtB [Arenibacter sp. 6A1]
MVVVAEILDFFLDTRKHTENLCLPLEAEDYVVQPISDVSPPKWHLGHTTWFFEEFILAKYLPDYQVFDPNFSYVFNSYYETVGKRVLRTDRGNLSRPTVKKVIEYRTYVTEQMTSLLEKSSSKELYDLVEIGIHHEKQHQELLLTDIKFILGNNPLLPVYSETHSENSPCQISHQWLSVSEGIYTIGHQSDTFCYDNELGKHKVYLNPYQISNLLVTNEDYLQFMNAGGYQDFQFWHADGWDWLTQNQLQAPLYWHYIDHKWYQYTLNGLQPLASKAYVTHISYYEAYAYAQWKGCRLPTEFEWEIAEKQFEWGQRWEWTESAYLPYPHYKKASGALGEYNGKFMVNQKVLRGSSIATPPKHARTTYRNFFGPTARWQFTGIRLAK